MRFRSLGLLAVMTMVVASCGVAPQSSGPNEGIAVHGDWTIEVYNEDGTLDERVEFENALHPEGAANLTGVLSGLFGGVSYWAIGLGSATGPCDPVCWIDPVQATSEATATGRVVRVNGSTVVDADGQIERVETALGTCGRIELSLCLENAGEGIVGTGSFRSITEKNLGPDFPQVSAGQTVDVTVVISFTSG